MIQLRYKLRTFKKTFLVHYMTEKLKLKPKKKLSKKNFLNYTNVCLVQRYNITIWRFMIYHPGPIES